MARQNLLGLLTGVQNTQQPISATNPQDWRMQFGQRQSEKMNQRLRGLTGKMSTQETIGAGLGQLDPNKPEDLKTIANLQRSAGDLAGAAKTAAVYRQVEQDKAIRATLIKRAKTLDMPDVQEFLVNGGDIGAATTILFRQPKAIDKPSDAGLSDNEIELYDAVLSKIDPKESDNIPFNQLSSADKRIIFQRAEEAVSKARDEGRTLTREQALRQVLKQPLPEETTGDKFANNFIIK